MPKTAVESNMQICTNLMPKIVKCLKNGKYLYIISKQTAGKTDHNISCLSFMHSHTLSCKMTVMMTKQSAANLSSGEWAAHLQVSLRCRSAAVLRSVTICLLGPSQYVKGVMTWIFIYLFILFNMFLEVCILILRSKVWLFNWSVVFQFRCTFHDIEKSNINTINYTFLYIYLKISHFWFRFPAKCILNFRPRIFGP